MTTSFIVLKKGETGLKVKRLQEVLTKLNFNVGVIDGIFGTKTEAAVIKFQQFYSHLPNNGIVDGETILQLDEAVWLSQRETLREGSRGNEVKLLQGMLEYSNFGSLIVDGVFGAKTKATIIDFQKARALKADGIVGQKTWSSLYSLARHDIPDEDRIKAFFGS
ncbi:MAG: peptidoglycan-binding protein [Nostocales cyanobacterium 94392]|nr:peptidoglycan-binding protein [Nostocales cyanobacterium 94392]